MDGRCNIDFMWMTEVSTALMPPQSGAAFWFSHF